MTNDKADLDYLNYQVKHGVPLEAALANLGYEKRAGICKHWVTRICYGIRTNNVKLNDRTASTVKYEPQTYRLFKDCDELIEFWSKHYQTGIIPAHTKPLIWVKQKEVGSVCLITAFDDRAGYWEDCVFLEDMWIDMKKLFENYEFLDGKPCGVEE